MAQIWIPFQEKIRFNLDKLLEESGFQPIDLVVDEGHPPVIYQRVNGEVGLQNLVFDGVEWERSDGILPASFNWLRVYLTVPPISVYLRQIGEKPPTSDIYSSQGWIYTNEDELDESIRQIAAIIREKLLV